MLLGFTTASCFRRLGLWGCLLWALGFYALEFRDYGVRILGLCAFAVAASRFNLTGF